MENDETHVVPIDGLDSGEIEVWAVELLASKHDMAQLQGVLSHDERQRAARFRFDHLRTRCIQARGTLRHLLARRVGCSPEALAFAYGASGKPSLPGSTQLQFNVSHSSDMAVYAFSLQCQLGVDVEQIRPMSSLVELAALYFCPEENDDLRSLTPEDRVPAFFRCWTRKEAYIKAVGDGLSVALDSFQVTLLPGVPARFIHIGHVAAAADRWMLHNLDLAPGYAAALAYRGERCRVDVKPLMTVETLLRCI